jgi:hypothetical protein
VSLSSPPGQRAKPGFIDPRGQRFGAAVSAILLALGFAAAQTLIVPLIGLALGVSAYLGTRWFVLGRPWPLVRRALRLEPPRELEHELPPRFAQALGALGLSLATLLFAVGLPAGGWLVAGVVAALQAVLAITGYCLGCRLYGLRWYAPRLFDRLIASAARDAAR